MTELIEQLDLFGEINPKFKLDKPILLIEMFGGIGSQAKALEILGLPFKHHKLVEWAYNSYVMYNMIHQKDFTDYSQGKSKEEMIERIKGTSTNYNEPLTVDQLKRKPIDWIKKAYNSCIATNNLVDISNVKGKDLDFDDNQNQTVVMTYSFPCQDLSLAGQLKGASKGSGTRSGLLWEVERILDERVSEKLPLPNVLLMENVSNLLSQNFIKDFQAWEQKLASIGYSNFVKVINAKNFGVPQNRERVFMISILGDYHYSFPLKIKLKYRIQDFIYKNVDEKYYLSEEFLDYASGKNYDNEKFDRTKMFISKLETTNLDGIAGTITTREGGRSNDTFIIDEKIQKVGNYGNGHHAKDIVDARGLSPTITTGNHGLGQTIRIRNNTKKGYLDAEEGDGIDIQGIERNHRGTVQKQIIQTLTTNGNNKGVVVKNEKQD